MMECDLLRDGCMVQRIRQAPLAIAVCVAILNACSTSTSVDQVWRDRARADAPMGKTLVLAVAPRSDTAVTLENEWVQQLRKRGVDAYALNAMLPGDTQVDKQAVVEVVKSNVIDTVLVSRLVQRKTVESEIPVAGSRGVPGYYSSWSGFYGTSRTVASNATYTVERQVAVVETNLYESKSEKLFWSARSDTFLEGSAAELIRGFVQAMIDQMVKSKVL